MELNYIRVNPAGNITGFILENLEEKYWQIIGKEIIENYDPSVEQVGIISKDKDSLRMDMMGGEFCGNATRSFGLVLAQYLGLEGEHELMLNVSGSKEPVRVKVNTLESKAEIFLPPAKAIESIEIQNHTYSVIILDGIIHLIAEKEEDKDFVKIALSELRTAYNEDAFGIMFYNRENKSLVPYVYVVDTDTLIREGSCGSGTLSIGYYLNKDQEKEFQIDIEQPGGIISLKSDKQDGSYTYSIGGPVDIGPKEIIKLNI